MSADKLKRRSKALTRRVLEHKYHAINRIIRLNQLIDHEEWDLAVHMCEELGTFCKMLRDDTNTLADLDGNRDR
jgi:hypothetical protein